MYFADGTESSASIVAANPANDIAALKPDQPPGVIVPATIAAGVGVGDDVVAVGNPLGGKRRDVRRPDGASST